MCGLKRYLATALIAIVCCSGIANALPWDEDLYKQQSHKANEISRNPAKNTVPVGRTPFKMSTQEAEKSLQNSVKFSRDSVWRGQRLYNANCLTCHGKTGAGEGPVGPQMSVPSLLDDFYKGTTDGKVFGVIYNGGASMPRYGYKFSSDEIWSMVNYLRFLQGRDVEGMQRPAKR